LSAKNQAFQIVFPSFLASIAVFLAVLVGVSIVRRRKTPSTTSTLSRILIAGPCLVVLWLAGFFVLRSMMERHAYREVALAGIFVVALLLWVLRSDSSKRQ
jgi:hypothetical protein